MAELSPAAQAVMDAVASIMEGGWIAPDFTRYEARKAAAILRAAVERLECDMPDDNAYAAGYYEALGEVEAIAAELEGAND